MKTMMAMKMTMIVMEMKMMMTSQDLSREVIRFTSNKRCLSPSVAFSSNAFFFPSRADGHSCSFKGKNQIRLRRCPRRVQITIMNFRAGVRNHCALFISHFETVVFCYSNSKVGSIMVMVMVAVMMVMMVMMDVNTISLLSLESFWL